MLEIMRCRSGGSYDSRFVRIVSAIALLLSGKHFGYRNALEFWTMH